MNILGIGQSSQCDECRSRFGDQHNYTFEHDHREAERFVAGSDVVFDFIIDEDPLQIEMYSQKTVPRIFFNTAKISLAELSNLANHKIKAKMFGFNGLPTFLGRDAMEVCILHEQDEDELKSICSALNVTYHLVDDRVGLVTPRIVSMIINEAYFTVQDGTASRDDIDNAMKLGTNYPFGPFEWCNKIGIKHVYELLEAVYEDTHDERYKISPLLKKEYLLS